MWHFRNSEAYSEPCQLSTFCEWHVMWYLLTSPPPPKSAIQYWNENFWLPSAANIFLKFSSWRCGEEDCMPYQPLTIFPKSPIWHVWHILVFYWFLDLPGNLGNVKEKPTRKKLLWKRSARPAPRICLVKFC